MSLLLHASSGRPDLLRSFVCIFLCCCWTRTETTSTKSSSLTTVIYLALQPTFFFSVTSCICIHFSALYTRCMLTMAVILFLIQICKSMSNLLFMKDLNFHRFCEDISDIKLLFYLWSSNHL